MSDLTHCPTCGLSLSQDRPAGPLSCPLGHTFSLTLTEADQC